MVFSGGPVVGLGRLDFVAEVAKMYSLLLERYHSFPFAVLLSPVNSFVFRMLCPRTVFSVAQILGIARGSEVCLSIVHPIVVDIVHHHAIIHFNNLLVHVNKLLVSWFAGWDPS